MDQEEAHPPPHVLVFPFPAQGHVNSMLKLAELLCLSDLHVTFVVSVYIHHRLLRHTDILSRFSRYPGFHLAPIPDGLPEENPRSNIFDLYDSLKATAKQPLRKLLVKEDDDGGGEMQRRPVVTCIIADGVMSFALEVAEEMGVPIIYIRTISACSFWTTFCFPKLIEAGEIPFDGNDMDVSIGSLPGMEDFLRRRDLPSVCRGSDLSTRGFQIVLTETQETPRAKAFILNTFEDLEGPILSHIRTSIPNVYTIGPLHTHVKNKLASTMYPPTSTSSASFLEEDKSCINWLNEQPLKSVIYVSFGSSTTVTREDLMEFWHGLVNSEKQFLWVIRPDSVVEKHGISQVPREILEGIKEKGYIVGWAPQEEVLAHGAIGGFLTHSGWNSTLESIAAGVPMICWPYFGDQQINSRFVGEVWKLGLDMKDTRDRNIVEKMVRELMDERKEEFLQKANQMAKLAVRSVSEGGSSHCNLERLVQDLRLMSADTHHS